VKWIKSFLLHPWMNRFNVLFLFAAFVLYWADPLDALGINNLGWMLLGGELAYLGVRGYLDRGAIPEFNIRKMKPKDRERYFALAERAAAAKQRLETGSGPINSMLSGSRDQLERMVQTFLKLQLVAHQIDQVKIENKKTDYDDEIAKVQAKLATAADSERAYLESNLDVLKKRRVTQADLAERRSALETRLSTIEHAVGLLSEVGLGASDPSETADQVQLVLANVEDAETFMDELSEIMAPIRVNNAN
jgi:hypothetical protein